MKTIKIALPATKEILGTLSAGDKVLLSGSIITARDKAHHRIAEMLDNKQELPFALEGRIVYYTGPVYDSRTGLFTSAGPTTSSRMDTVTEPLLKAGVIGFIGKGHRSEEVGSLLKEYRAVYFSAVGGAGVYLAERIKKTKIIAFPELHTEAVFELTVEDFPCYVTIAASGKILNELRMRK